MKLWNRFINWLAGPQGWLIADATPTEQHDLSRLDRLDGMPRRIGINIEDHIHHCRICQEQREMFSVEKNDYPT